MAPRPLSTNRWDAVDDICEFRKYELVKAAPNVRPAGRLLVYFPDEDLTDGAAESPRRPGYLLAWVPDALAAVASAGIDVNPEQCIAWLTDVQVGLRSIIDEVELR